MHITNKAILISGKRARARLVSVHTAAAVTPVHRHRRGVLALATIVWLAGMDWSVTSAQKENWEVQRTSIGQESALPVLLTDSHELGTRLEELIQHGQRLFSAV